uniref:Uncharacterized protein n=1 Tax=Micrurus carvalhoi TaxID=3147026 RepID=A0A2H6N237_9SAUR
MKLSIYTTGLNTLKIVFGMSLLFALANIHTTVSQRGQKLECLSTAVSQYLASHKIQRKYKEILYKMFYRWYFPTARLAKMFKDMSAKCWKCNQILGLYYHMWWMCPKAKTYWNKNTYLGRKR